MTGGVVAVLGPTGRNFAAGMTGGIAFVLGSATASSARASTASMVGARRPDRATSRSLRDARSSATATLTGSDVARERCWPTGTRPLATFVEGHAARPAAALADRARAARAWRCAAWLTRAGSCSCSGAAAPLPARRARCATTRDVQRAARRGRARARAGAALHGLRRAVLPHGLPARQPDPRLERPRAPRRLARGHRPAALDEQLPRVHRQALPGAVRGGVRAHASTTTR